MAAVTICSDFEAPKIKSVIVSIVSPSVCYEVMGPDLVIWTLTFNPTFSPFSFTFIKRLCSFSSLSAIRVVSSAYLRLLIFLPAILIPALLHPAQHVTWWTLPVAQISRVTIYSLDILLSLFGTSLLFHVQFYLLLLELHTDFSGGRSGGLVFPSL